MMKIQLNTVVALLFTISGMAAEPDRRYPDPARFETAIKHFEAQDAQDPPLAGGLLCIGSSSMRMWHDTIDRDLAPFPLIKRGFGGSTMLNVLHFSDRIVLPYRPRAIVLYEGDNDIARGVPPTEILKTFISFRQLLHSELPDCRLFVLSIKPSPKRWNLWPAMQEANRLLQAECADDERLIFVDIATPMLNPDGRPQPELFLKDRLHMNRAGYETWRDTLRPVLQQHLDR